MIPFGASYRCEPSASRHASAAAPFCRGVLPPLDDGAVCSGASRPTHLDPRSIMRIRTSAAAAFLLAAASLGAQAPKKVLTQADWDRWESIGAPTLCSTGAWVAYNLTPSVGDGWFVVRSTSGATEYRINRGYVAQPNNTPGGARGQPAQGIGANGARGGAAQLPAAN